MNHKIIASVLVIGVLFVGTVALTGCIEKGENGEFRLLVSDQPADIDDFESLNVTIEKIRIEPQDETQEPITETLEEPRNVDITTVTGQQAAEIIKKKVPTGNYSKIELHVQDHFDSPGAVKKTPGVVKQSVIDSEQGPERFIDQKDVQVMIPSGKLQINKNFSVTGNGTTSFVFDMKVVLKGATGEYNLQPNLLESGVEGKDVPQHQIREGEGLPEQEGGGSTEQEGGNIPEQGAQ